MDARPQRRLLHGDPRQAAPAGHHGPGLRLPGGQRRGAAGELLLAAALDPPDDPRRKQHPAFGLGTFTDLGGSNPSVLSYVREHFGDDIECLCVNNLSRFPQPVELDLRRWEGMVPVELLGGVPFPAIGELPYLLTLGWHGFYWFRLTDPARTTGWSRDAHPPALDAITGSSSRWFGGKGRGSRSSDVHGSATVPAHAGPASVAVDLVEASTDDDGERPRLPAAAGVYAEPQDRPSTTR